MQKQADYRLIGGVLAEGYNLLIAAAVLLAAHGVLAFIYANIARRILARAQAQAVSAAAVNTGRHRAAVGAVTAHALHMRDEPDPAAEVVGYLSHGDTVVVLQRAPSGWLLVRDSSGRAGWVLPAYVYVAGEVRDDE